MGISEQTFYRWKKRCAGLESDEVGAFKQLSDENGRLKKLVADSASTKPFYRMFCQKSSQAPALMKKIVAYVAACHGNSERRACALTRQNRSTQRKPSVRDPRLEIRQRMHEIVRTRIRYGYRCIHIMLKRDGLAIGRLSHSEMFRALTVVDVFSREALAIEVGKGFAASTWWKFSIAWFGREAPPQYLCADNGAEFTGHLVDLWAYHNGVRLDFSRRGKPTDNAFIETFNGSPRDECMNVHWFETITEARRLIEARRIDDNESRPHMALGNIPPCEYASQAKTLTDPMGSIAVGN